MGADLGKELAALQRLPVGKLRERYAEAFGEPPSGNCRPWLARRIAWWLQERAERAGPGAGGRAGRRRRPAGEPPAGGGPERTAPVPPPPPDPRLPAPGTVLSRPYKGGVLEVKVLAGGFEFAGRRYGSLSAVAKAATGSHCNGFAFFGLAKGEQS